MYQKSGWGFVHITCCGNCAQNVSHMSEADTLIALLHRDWRTIDSVLGKRSLMTNYRAKTTKNIDMFQMIH